ncbi:hypothetical protein M3A96_10270 [Helcobacillus massiliensis]|uniref:hypothetical protein n=1 Tax=Helcobacillus massiliensis TaxID=521392 RepID=UPI0021A5ED8A|nr:hypothetical protein [Helcobacillus massiliensis]MCT1558495.1 hypothetical protein [Helcobacillus massiliensis]MCT2036034.1 hypothetical protein [Helcobacillus massiliensis]MCT2332734.1 hypothetical protein [Helcobacillus massiliensis]
MSDRSSAPTLARRPRPLRAVAAAALAAGVLVTGAACSSDANGGGNPGAEVRMKESQSPELKDGAASDAGGAENTAGSGVPRIDSSARASEGLTDACTGEGAVTIAQGEEPEPAMKDGEDTVKFAFEGAVDGEHVKAAQFTIDLGDGPQKMEPANIGDQFEIGEHRYSVTSVCDDSAALDVVQ